ncbi:MAG: exodeoxyribonuclease III [Saprospiraceae bacterium]|nr:exodeoxyribonuclease III [Saprospiraceae bacterium]
MHIVTYNVNGLRAAINKGWVNWVEENDFDVICVQEIKANQEQVDTTRLQELGYSSNWFSAQKKGYSGVATFSKKKPDYVSVGCGNGLYDDEGRILRTDFGDLTIINVYIPSGTSGDHRQAIKMEFLDFFHHWVGELLKERPQLIVVGDYNIAHNEIDIHDPKGNKNSTGFLPEERAWMTKWFASNLTDSFRFLYPNDVQYSWWTYRANARINNKGWRIDYISVSDSLQDRLVQAKYLNDAVHSDHCPLWLELNV